MDEGGPATVRTCRLAILRRTRWLRPNRRPGMSAIPECCWPSEASAKAERARRRWQTARLIGNAEAARRHRRLMLRHQAIAWHLDPQRRDASDTA